ncbi:GNAT family N-acetyltransferase [Halodesulfovibrio sp.]|jgi:predicted GNAT family N-acyltransferase|uniref:GNAT family N-acetyltransferase n=1 Tax=Halodesulfovibrio sp. TaxID=1912772 RepID=UPI0025DF5615|nr:GNAT family N-acetyltransferase [Halodesulfovibrio sp.]MCT4535317.1 GNAT family N-acetyltransferase [Halodesulfovibrio sp.]
MLYSVEEIDTEHDLYEPTVAMRQVDLYPVGRVTRSYIQDELENKSILLVALKNRTLLGCGRITIEGDVARLSHMVVGEEFRFTGVGTSLMKKLMETSKEKGATKIVLEASSEAVPFFKSFGFTTVGNTKILDILDLPASSMELTV